MDDIPISDTELNSHQSPKRKPSRDEAEYAVRTLIEWAGEDPDREGLVGTPARVVRAYEEFFAGYKEDPVALEKRVNFENFVLPLFIKRDIPSKIRISVKISIFSFKNLTM